MRDAQTQVEESRAEYLARLQRLAADCRELDSRSPDAQQQTASDQLIMLAEALERLEEEVNEIRHAQHASGGMTTALERRMSALEQSTPSPQSWRDLIQGIRTIRDLVGAQTTQRRRPGGDD